MIRQILSGSPGCCAVGVWPEQGEQGELLLQGVREVMGGLGPSGWEEWSFSRYILLVKEMFLHGSDALHGS